MLPAIAGGVEHLGSGLISQRYTSDARVTLFSGDRLDLLKQLPERSAQLVVTSPPYNLGKKYEKRGSLEHYLDDQRATIAACARGHVKLRTGGHRKSAALPF